MNTKINKEKFGRVKTDNLKRGIAPLIIILIVALLAGGGGVTYLAVKGKPISVDSVRENILGGETKEEALDNLSIESTDFDVSVSPLPKLELNALNLRMPEIATPKLGDFNTNFNTEVSVVKASNINLGTPNLSNMMPQISIPSIPTGGSIPPNITIPTIPTQTGAPTDMGEISAPPSTGVVPPETGVGSAPSGAPSVDCSMFSSVPSCSYVPAGQAQDACRSCFPNK
ncbi:MAG: hypothetical protein UT05_C0004G0016 [Parcubacteria group bacterium GW2011_GWF2_38_76]|nr:MAG: hypothetical protein UT05_C0004G0016 [Parcubacteria group bacterium GW2011_GWF2_38_76]HBM45678.1 hypothetical protein [Patescibacteria group bacterium]